MNKGALEHSLVYMDSWLAFRYERDDIPGYVVAVAHQGKLLFNRAYGYADLERKTKLTPQHIFRIASHSKTFTATALMQLAEQDKLRLDDYAVLYLPWLQKHKDERWRRVTLRQLLSHGAGVIRDGLNADYWQLERPFPAEQELKAAVLETELVVDNNTKLKYSNYGYSLLGLIVEVVSGQPYADYVAEHIIQPLGLSDTGPEYSPRLADRMVTGYSRREIEGKRLPIAPVDTQAMAAATGFYSTAADLCRYFAAHFVGSGQLLSDELKKEMQRVQWHAKPRGKASHEDYGLGLELVYADKRHTIGHGGGFPGQITKTMADPKDQLVVVALTNCIDGPAEAMAKGIYGIIDYFQEHTPARGKPKHDMHRVEGRYLDLWATTDIVVTGDKVAAVYPDSWEPMSDPEQLEYVDDTTLRITETSSFESEDELVRFVLQNGKVKTVNYCGATMWPEREWQRKQASRSRVG